LLYFCLIIRGFAVGARPSEWDMSFFMPSGKSIEDLPKPDNSKVKIAELKERKMIIYKFRGSMNDENFEKYNIRLMQYIKQNNLAIRNPAISAAYSSPFTPWFMKHSEIMYEFL
jgi:effector-binding domain-containing protein